MPPPAFDALLADVFRSASGPARGAPIALDDIAEVFYDGRQEDAREFLQELFSSERAPLASQPLSMQSSER
eukprot:3452728-Pyramimonas_sp.AAC.1